MCPKSLKPPAIIYHVGYSTQLISLTENFKISLKYKRSSSRPPHFTLAAILLSTQHRREFTQNTRNFVQLGFLFRNLRSGKLSQLCNKIDDESSRRTIAEHWNSIKLRALTTSTWCGASDVSWRCI